MTYHNADFLYPEEGRVMAEGDLGHPWPAPVETALDVAIKFDQEKDPWHLMPWDAARCIVKILAFGAGKYAPRNWEKGMPWSRCYSALLRHVTAWWDGEDKDMETGYSHLWHAGCCIVFLIAYELRGIGKDDRPHTKQEVQ